jgi:hypothetical protein
MNALDLVNQFLRALERRLRFFALSRGSAITAAVALSVTVLLVFLTNRFAFSETSLFWARGALVVALGIAIALGAVLPYLRVNRRRAAARVERDFPQFKQRLLTIAERDPNRDDPFVALLAGDAMDLAQAADTSRVAPVRSAAAFVLSAVAASALLLWLILAGPGYLGHGASLLWAGVGHTGSAPFYDIVVTPGDRTVRRRTDQMVTAELVGFDTQNVRLRAKFQGSSKWEDVPMQPRPGAPGYEFVLAAIPNSVEYYVSAGPVHSKTFILGVVDLPSIKKLRVTYKYPAWTGMKPATEDPGGDLRAVEGTVAEVTIQTDRPMSNGVIALDDDKQIQLTGEGTTLHAEVPIKKDGMYHFAALDRGQAVRLGDDYFIEAQKDNPPTLKVVKPGRDAKVSPIEEVQIGVEAGDDFGLREVALHYSVNGGPEKTVNLMRGSGAKEVKGATTLFLEDYKLVPGDVVAMYATARDARNPAKSDMYFLEAQPYEREYSQSQQQGGGQGDQEDEGGQISKRQKEIIAATWNETKGQASRNKSESTENAHFLTEVQGKLRDQAKSLSERAKSRQLAGTNAEFQAFIKDMDEAVKEMSAAQDKLKGQGWNDALGPEQRALQHLLRAEATFKQIQVAFGNRGAGGGGKSGAARDLDNLFDLELDTEKNQYETGQQNASSDQRQRDVDEALQKLEQLARRQQELAQQQQQKQNQSFEQRWQQEQLRREAEELRRKMEQLSRNSDSQQSSQSSSEAQGTSGQQSQSGKRSSSQRASSSRPLSREDARLKQAFDRLSQATDDMRKAASSPEQREAGARRAAERLQEAKDMLRGMRQEQSSTQLGDLAQRADQLANEQQDIYNRMRQQFGSGMGAQASPRSGPQPGQTQAGIEKMAQDKERMAKQLDDLERDAQRAARDLTGTQPRASSKLRDALSAIQQDEVKLRMQYSARWLRQGKGQYMVTSEAVASMALNKMRDQVKAAQSELEKSGQQQGKQAGAGETSKALAQIEKLREELQRAANGDRGQQGQQRGQGKQPGQQQGQGRDPGQGQQPGQQRGDQPGGDQPGGSNDPSGGQMRGGQRAGDIRGGYGTPNRGNLPDRGSEGPVGFGGGVERTLRETIRDLSQLRQSAGASSDVGREITDFLRDLQRLDPSAYALQGPALSDRIDREVLPQLEQLELQLRRKVDAENGGTVRNSSADRIPPGYSDKVADYFRRLSGAHK